MMHIIEEVIEDLRAFISNTEMTEEQKETLDEVVERLLSAAPQNLQEAQKMEITEKCFIQLNLSDLEIIELIYLK